jgi:hypothetical protein
MNGFKGQVKSAVSVIEVNFPGLEGLFDAKMQGPEAHSFLADISRDVEIANQKARQQDVILPQREHDVASFLIGVNPGVTEPRQTGFRIDEIEIEGFSPGIVFPGLMNEFVLQGE